MNNNSEFMPVECLNVPKVLFYDKQYEDLSMDAKLIYALRNFQEIIPYY